MDFSVAECKTVDEQKQIILLATPVMTQDRYAQLTGLTEGQVRGQLTHICRHTFSSHFVMNGGHILTLQKVLGHSDLKLTMRYAHLAPDYLEEVIYKGPLFRN